MVISGKMGFRGSKKYTYAAQVAAEDAAKVVDAGLKK